MSARKITPSRILTSTFLSNQTAGSSFCVCANAVEPSTSARMIRDCAIGRVIIMPRMKALIAAAFFISAFAQTQPHTIEQRLSAKEERLEKLYAEYWRAQYKNARGDKSASSIPVQKQIRELV